MFTSQDVNVSGSKPLNTAPLCIGIYLRRLRAFHPGRLARTAELRGLKKGTSQTTDSTSRQLHDNLTLPYAITLHSFEYLQNIQWHRNATPASPRLPQRQRHKPPLVPSLQFHQRHLISRAVIRAHRKLHWEYGRIIWIRRHRGQS